MEDQPIETTQSVHYGGFWRRAAAAFVDSTIFYIATLWVREVSQSNIWMFVTGEILLVAGWLMYRVYFHARWGQTLGKMFSGVKVVRPDFTNITWRNALLRASVDIGLTACTLVLYILYVAEFPFRIVEHIPVSEWEFIFGPNHMGGSYLLFILAILWFFGELLTLLFNEKRRALHDFLGSTVVIEVSGYPSSHYPPPDVRTRLAVTCYVLWIVITSVSAGSTARRQFDMEVVYRSKNFETTVEKKGILPAITVSTKEGKKKYELKPVETKSFKEAIARHLSFTEYGPDGEVTYESQL